jgi:CRP/FNR family cyclic AMP-dependent transcriptional regulator
MPDRAPALAAAGDEQFLHLPIYRRQRFAADAIISNERSPREVQVVVDGVVRLSLVSRDGRERVLVYLAMGCIFGEQQALAADPADPDETSSATAFADTDCVIGYVKPDDLIARIQTDPKLLRTLLRVTHQKKHQLMGELERAVFQSARSQLAALLSALTRDAREPGAIKISHDRLAQLSGRTRVTIGTQLHALESAGAIRLERSRIVILDPNVLGAIADER